MFPVLLCTGDAGLAVTALLPLEQGQIEILKVFPYHKTTKSRITSSFPCPSPLFQATM